MFTKFLPCNHLLWCGLHFLANFLIPSAACLLLLVVHHTGWLSSFSCLLACCTGQLLFVVFVQQPAAFYASSIAQIDCCFCFSCFCQLIASSVFLVFCCLFVFTGYVAQVNCIPFLACCTCVLVFMLLQPMTWYDFSYFLLAASHRLIIADKNWTGLTIQIIRLHWQNNSKQWIDWSCNKAMTTTMKQVIENTRKPPEESWWTKVPLWYVPLRVYTMFQGQEHFHSC